MDEELKRLREIDQRLRKLFPTEMWVNNETIVTIRMFGGFEIFNSYPYHNYENWASGYEITTGERYGNLKVTAENLDEAILKLEKEVEIFRLGWTHIWNKKPEIGDEIEVWDGSKILSPADARKITYSKDSIFFWYWRKAQ
jgi:hypothetical protein